MKARDKIKERSQLVQWYDIANFGTIRVFCSSEHIEGGTRFRARCSGCGSHIGTCLNLWNDIELLDIGKEIVGDIK